MNTTSFLTCLGYYGVSTGTSAYLEGLYSSTSGTTGYLYNQLYPTGLHQSGNILYGPALPLISVGKAITGTLITGNQCLRAGYQHSGNFGVLLDLEYSGCSRGIQSGLYSVIFSTVESPLGLSSGFTIAINDSNRLNFKTNSKNYTLAKELSTHDIVYIALTESQYVTMSIFSVKENLIYSKEIDMGSPMLNSNSMYFLNYLNPTNPYTGFTGRFNNALLFSDDISDIDVGICSMCSLVTGYTQTSLTRDIVGNLITGFYYSGFQVTGYTGLITFTGQVKRSDGSLMPILYTSGVSGYITTGEVASPLLSNVMIRLTGSGYSFQYNQNYLNTFLTKSLEFDLPLTSGDIVEVYNYPYINNKIGKKVTGTAWPIQTGNEYIQIIGNGLNETSGVDFYVNHNVISGFYDTDILSYDLIKDDAIVTAYSGYWASSKITMSGGTFYPPSPQYPESGGIVFVSGISGVTAFNPYFPDFGYDLFLNGQKLISGIHYDLRTGTFGVYEIQNILDSYGNPILDASGNPILTSGFVSSSGFNLLLSGQNLPLLLIEGLYHPTGGLPTGIGDVEDSELTFLPQFSGFSRTIVQVTGTLSNIGNITGFNEQIWVNGLRQFMPVDYLLHSACDAISSILDEPYTPAIMYDSVVSNNAYVDFPRFPVFTNLFLSGQYNINNALIDLSINWNIDNSYPTIYPNLSTSEVWIDTNGPYGNYLVGRIHVGMADGSDNFTISGNNFFTGTVKMRYVSGNSHGPWSTGSNTLSLSY